jgi:hypothetical protein
MPLVEEGKRLADGGDLDRLKDAIDDQHVRVEHALFPKNGHYNPPDLKTLRKGRLL